MTEWTFPTAFSSWRHGDGGPESAAIDRVLRSGRLTMGPETEAFEAEFAAYHGRRHCVMVNSGSSANEVAMAAIRERHYPEFLDGAYEGPRSASVPSIAWNTTYGPCHRNGYGNFDPRDADDTWNSPLPPLRQIGVPRWSWSDVYVICPVLGTPLVDCDKIAGLKEEHPGGCLILEDACESLGARTADGRLTGTFGDLSTFSFFYSHQLSAIEGGAILTDDDALGRLCRLLRNHGNAGWGADLLEDQYNFQLFGYNLRPQEINAAVAREQLKRLDEMNRVRRENWMHFNGMTVDLPLRPQLVPHGVTPAPFGLAFECESTEARSRLALALRAKGIDCRLPTGGSFLRHPYGAPWRDQQTPRADQIHDRGMFLGNAPRPIPDLIEAAVKVMRETL